MQKTRGLDSGYSDFWKLLLFTGECILLLFHFRVWCKDFGDIANETYFHLELRLRSLFVYESRKDSLVCRLLDFRYLSYGTLISFIGKECLVEAKSHYDS